MKPIAPFIALSLLSITLSCAQESHPSRSEQSRGNAKSKSDERGEITYVPAPPADRSNTHYVSNRAPLAQSPFVKLPIGAITPGGWLRTQLQLERDGMVGHLPELSEWAKWEGNAWVNPEGKGHSGWEELPYWLKGYGDLGYVLQDQHIIDEAQKWIEAAFRSQREDGYFGPRSSLSSLKGKPDFWPNMLMLNVMQTYYEHSSDPRVLDFMKRYFQWQMSLPEDQFLTGYWPVMRGGDNLESIYWLYNRTGDKWLLDLATRIHKHTANWTSSIPNGHGVNVTQGFREPAEYWMQSHEEKHLKGTEHVYDYFLGTYGQFPGGGFGADENVRPGYTDPRQGFETCSMVEFMHSFEMLTKITGDSKWADRCEDVAFNLLPAAMTPDAKGLHYLTCANQVQLDKNNKAPAIENGGTMFSYSPYAVYRCCQHNVSHGWPYYAEELWLATSDNGLCASLYCHSEVKAKVGDGVEVMIEEQTAYPFNDKVRFVIHLPRPTKFPFYLRQPGTAAYVHVSRINERRFSRPPSAPSDENTQDGRLSGYLVLDREWKNGDEIEIQMTPALRVRTWEKNKNSVSIDYGPLTFSLDIRSQWQPYGKPGAWPEFEVFPTSPWNYGLEINPKKPYESLKVMTPKVDRTSTRPIDANPFTPENTPIRIMSKAKRIPGWTTDKNGMVNPLSQSPVRSDQPTEEVQLIPMGAARLRITSFPVIGEGPNAHDWQSPPKLPEASHTWQGDTTAALNDGQLPKSSNDQSIPRFTWWDHRGTSEWVQYDFDKPRKLSASDVYWFDDTGKGQCRVPASWQLFYREGNGWKPVENSSAFPTDKDHFNHTTFTPVTTTAIRLQAKLQPNYSAGILEWKVE